MATIAKFLAVWLVLGLIVASVRWKWVAAGAVVIGAGCAAWLMLR